MTFIQDQASNAFQTQTVKMLGFLEPEQAADALQQRMYLFLIDILRQEDQARGQLFLKRFLEGENGDSGPQSIWNTQHTTIRAIPGLWDVNDVSTDFLPFLRRIVGWTSDIEDIPLALSGNALRRLLATSVAFWKRRGPDDAMLDLLNQVTDGVRVRVLDWFDYRLIMNEAEMGYVRQGTDPHMITESDQYRYNIRIVDDGTLNRTVVKRVAEITRPINERVDISYLGFLDMFQVNADVSQWSGDTKDFAVLSGLATLGAGEGVLEVYANPTPAVDWVNYTFTFVARWSFTGASDGAGAVFYRTGANDYYSVYIDVSAGADENHLILEKVVAGTPTVLSNVYLSAFGILVENAAGDEHGIRVEAMPDSGLNRIRVYVDGVKVVDLTDGSHAHGTIGFFTRDVGDVLTLREIEMFFNPMESDSVEINN